MHGNSRMLTGKQWWRQISHQALAQTTLLLTGPQMLIRMLGPIERREESETLDVVHVQMGQQDIDAADGRVDGLAQTPDARPRVEHKYRTVLPVAHPRTTCCRRSGPCPRPAWQASRGCPRA